MIKLARPVFHAELLDFIRKVLKAVCFNCSHLMADNETNDSVQKELASYQTIVNAKARFNKVQKLAESTSVCSKCQARNRKYTKESPLKIEFEILDVEHKKKGIDTKQTLWPEEAKAIFDKITPKHLNMLGLNKNTSNPSNMIIENLTVTPPPVRPSVMMPGCSQRSEDDLTVAYREIVKQN
jgi:DNA-directed RNA polymerase beta' subunit